MPITTLNFEQIRDAMLRDLVNQDTTVAVGRDSDFRLRANATAAAIEGLHQNLSWTARQIFPDSADEDILLRYASLYSIAKKPATPATGAIKFTGAQGSVIEAGIEAKALDGSVYVTTATGTIGADGTVTVAARAAANGFGGNQAAGTALTLTWSPAGVSSSALLVSMTTGTDVESTADLLARLLDRLRHPPAGGNKHDYRRWALEVPGVSHAWCYPLRRGLGTVDLAILSNGLPATQELINTVRAYVETVNPAGGECRVLTPTRVPVNVSATVAILGISLAEVGAIVRNVLSRYIASLNPGETVLRGRILASLTDIPGVTDVVLHSPTESVVTRVDANYIEMAELGSVVIA